MKAIILSNKIQCLHCNDVIESVHTHDFKFCSCKSVAADGGKSYLKRLGNPSDYIDLSEVVSEEDEDYFLKARESFTWKSYGKNGEYPEGKYIALKDLTTDHIQAILNTQWHIKGTYVEGLMQKELEHRGELT